MIEIPHINTNFIPPSEQDSEFLLGRILSALCTVGKWISGVCSAVCGLTASVPSSELCFMLFFFKEKL